MTNTDTDFVRSLAAKAAASYFNDARDAELAILAEILSDDLTAAIPYEDGDPEDLWTPTLEAVSAALKSGLMSLDWPSQEAIAEAERDVRRTQGNWSARAHLLSLTRVTAELLGYKLEPLVTPPAGAFVHGAFGGHTRRVDGRKIRYAPCDQPEPQSVAENYRDITCPRCMEVLAP
jgi:hypothetical protein